MRQTLPADFLDKMSALLGPEAFRAFLESYRHVPKKGLRANTLKAGRDEMVQHIPFKTQPIPWCDTGVYIDAEERPGKQLAYNAGLYYVQEPSAMIPAAALAPRPGERVLDMCAAPGGKTTQLACALENQGLLVANEVVKTRAKVLASNVERMGITNAAITNVRPDQLIDIFGPASFDKILVDAPCSGEGMFRKDPAVAAAWRLENVAQCARRQKKMLETVDILLKPGGALVYSTCTFAPEEDEQIVEYLVQSGKYEAQPITLPGLPDHGRPEWTAHGCEAVKQAVRVMPHRVEGEGHFIAKLKKTAEAPSEVFSKRSRPKKKKRSLWRRASKKDLKDFTAFSETVGLKWHGSDLIIAGDVLIALPEGLYPDQLDRGKWVRPGLEIGTFKKGRFEPAHTFAMALKADQIASVYDFKDEDEAYAYLKGEPIVNAGAHKGWTLMCWLGYPLGWGKASGGTIKNHFPKGLRILKK
ncbi:RsmF rRNA methyltransferase first C-terminal domain-containing protein [Pseudoramibacter porci]|uniref:RsmF rRNA methyltransferase first C-terminal domain-containing protein n=1 Tax=Pseudoramibacter porci TaxID=2606631 RepID=UPI001F3E0815|nr:RsmF rRNA methyltransferase first C-terminal domain-containing protein [Pseudoramibacter porci]